MGSLEEVFGKPISVYTRAQAIEDGVLADLVSLAPDVCRQHHPGKSVVCTAAVWEILERALTNKKTLNDINGLVHDLLWMSKVAPCRIKGMDAGPEARFFQVIINGAGRQKQYVFKLHVGPGDSGEPVITILKPEED